MNGQQKRKFNGPDGSGEKRFHDGDNAKREKDILAEAPREIAIMKYVQAHVSEIQYLHKAIERDGQGITTAQKLPRHLQRRAMSHNIKRLPRSVRTDAAKYYADLPVKKKQSRYHRRRPKNLLAEYARRQRRLVWLETHIWHAKRFHMLDKWGYKIPWKPTDKSERACYRAMARHCLLQDLSYMCCVEISGSQDTILAGLAHVTSTNTGFTFAAKTCLSGTREGHTVLYEQGRYPYGAIAPVTFTWKPLASSTDPPVSMTTGQRKLWLWCHPCCFDQVWKELKECFNMDDNLEKSEDSDDKPTDNKTDDTKTEKCTTIKQEAPKKCIDDKFKATAENASDSVSMKSLTGSILRFRLTGPQSGSVLFDALEQANVLPESQTDQSEVWWKHHYAQTEASLGHGAQREVTEKMRECQSPAELPPRCVVGMTVRDPRLGRPDKRTKVQSQETDISVDVSVCKEKITPDVSSSPLWEPEIREQVTANKMPDFAMNKMKSENLIPGTPLNLGDVESRVPVILIQRPGAATSQSATRGQGTSTGQGAGWDVLMPRGWGMPFWLSLVYRGARCGGLKETENLGFEGRCLVFPGEFPDSQAGITDMEESEKAAVAKYNRRPPAKRPNFTKFGVVSPFSCPWKWLVKEWTSSQSDDITTINDKFYVLRDAKILRRLQGICENGRVNSGRVKDQTAVFQETMTELRTSHSEALVPVRVDMVQRGVAGQFSMVCIPSAADLASLEKDKDYGGPLEPKHTDPVENKKKVLKKEMKEKNIKKKVKVDRHLTVVGEKDELRVRTVSRDVIGFLTSGGFSLGSGNGAGKGFVSAPGLVEMLQQSGATGKQKGIVLVRSTSSLQYRFERLTVLI